MKTAKKIVAAVDLLCPYCGEDIPAPDGSLFWTVEELELCDSKEHLTCNGCDRAVKFPRVGR